MTSHYPREIWQIWRFAGYLDVVKEFLELEEDVKELKEDGKYQEKEKKESN